MSKDGQRNCPVCKRPLECAAAIGPYCANAECQVLDDYLLWSEDGTRSAMPPLIQEEARPAAGQRLWRSIETAPDNELVLVWDYGTIRQAMKTPTGWASMWKNVPPPVTPTFWLPLPPAPDGAAV
jgi:endogenous inhibitor of DNA gyrase (YacG/DUF329 family)